MEAFNSEARYQELAEKWLNNTITSEEKQEFAHYYNSGQYDDVNLPENFAVNEQELKDRIFSGINMEISGSGRSAWLQTWYAAAAVIIIVLAGGLHFYLGRPDVKRVASKADRSIRPPSEPKKLNIKQHDVKVFHRPQSPVRLTENVKPSGTEVSAGTYDIKPKNDNATLILGNGREIVLDDAKNGILAIYNGICISKNADGELTYSSATGNSDPGKEINDNTNLNTIKTPKGGKFLITLTDGSKIWLNAASSLRFPVVFAKDKRQVQLTGEAYFEVAHEEDRLFEVVAINQTVEVLGTHFNINAYANEPYVRTTLLEGSVRIFDLLSNMSQLLKPGEQAKLGTSIEIIPVENTAQTVAWKNGYFEFNGADIKTVMRQIERWYDVSVRYEGSVRSERPPRVSRFSGEIERSLSLLQVLNILERTKVHFRLEGREVVVMM